MELPKAFEEKMKALLGDEFDSYARLKRGTWKAQRVFSGVF